MSVENVRTFAQTPFGVFHRVNNIVAFVVGLISIGLLLFLIRWKTPRYLREYSRLLLMSTSIDLFGLLVLFWSQSRFKATALYQIIVFVGPASLLNSKGQCYTLMLYMSVPQIDCILTSITALYRHQYIKNKVAPSNKQLLSYLFASLFFIAISAILSAQDYCGDIEDAAKLWYVESELPSQFMVGGLKTGRLVSFGRLYRKIVMFTGLYLTIFIVIASIRHMRRTTATLTLKVKRLQRAFNNILITQTMIPVISVIVPFLVVTLLTFAKNDLELSEWPIIFLTWAAPLNAIANLCIIAPYRREILRIFLPCCRTKSALVKRPTVFSATRNS